MRGSELTGVYYAAGETPAADEPFGHVGHGWRVENGCEYLIRHALAEYNDWK